MIKKSFLRNKTGLRKNIPSKKNPLVVRKPLPVKKPVEKRPALQACKVFVLYSAKTGPSGRALAKHMRTQTKEHIAFGDADELRRYAKNGVVPPVVVNIGETDSSVIPTGVKTVLNHPSKVARSSNKRGSRISFRDNKIPAPELWLEHTSIPDAKFPVVGRTTNHTKAQGFWFCKNKLEAAKAAHAGATHFLRFISDTREFRVHVAAQRPGDKRTENEYASIKMSEKLPKAGAKSSAIIKNHDSGWVFEFPKIEGVKGLFSRLRDAARKSLALFDMDWGAVDIMYCAKNDSIFVLEINSSPCLTDDTANTVEKYTSWILHLSGLKTMSIAPKAPIPAKKVGTTTTKSLRDRIGDNNMERLKSLLRKAGKV